MPPWYAQLSALTEVLTRMSAVGLITLVHAALLSAVAVLTSRSAGTAPSSMGSMLATRGQFTSRPASITTRKRYAGSLRNLDRARPLSASTACATAEAGPGGT